MVSKSVVALSFLILMSVSSLYGQTGETITPQEKGAVVSLPGEAFKVDKPFVYEVAAGDNLHWLAAKFYGDARQWTRIYDANRGVIRNPNRLEVGQKLSIPAASPSP